MAETLNTKIVKGVSWSLIETFVAYFIRFFIGILLARILMPSDFGMIGMITIFIAISDVSMIIKDTVKYCRFVREKGDVRIAAL